MSNAAYSETEVRRWLGWLACGMRKHGQSVFAVEQLQPSWFIESERNGAFGKSILVQFAILVLPYWLVLGWKGWQLGWSGVTAAISDLSTAFSTQANLRAIIIFVCLGAVVAFFAIGGFGMVLMAKRLSRPDIEYIRPAERLSWSTDNFWRGFSDTEWGSYPSFWFVKLPFAVVRGFSRGMKATAVPLKTAPNRGIFLSCRNALYFLVPSLIPILFGNFFLALVLFAVGMYPAAWYGGFDAIDHYLVRRRMQRLGYAPKDYVEFLDYAAVELGFLQKAGGAYLFMHRQLLEYFADEYETATAPPDAPAPLS